MMTKELRDKWVTALRSGRYQRGKYCLRDREGGFCPLGVLLDVSGLGEWIGGVDRPYRYKPHNGESPYRHHVPENLIPLKKQRAIISSNDFNQADFHETARWVEENVETEEATANQKP